MNNDSFQAYDYVPQPIFVLAPDADNRPVYAHVNTAALQYFEQPLEALRGLPAYKAFRGRAAYSIYRRQCSAWGKGVATEHDLALSIDQKKVWLRTHLMPVDDAAGRMTHMVATLQDITADMNTSHAHAMEAALVREVEDMVCFAAHDLRMPISNLKSLAELMRVDFVDHGDGKAHLIDMIDTISEKALSVVATIMGQVTGSSAGVTHDIFDLGDVCDDIMVMLDPTQRHCVSYPRLHLEADSMAVHITLRNLVGNALKHSSKNVAQVVIETTQTNAGRLLFMIRDDGSGFADDAFTKQSVLNENDVLNFGLKGVQRLVHARGGQLTVMPPTSGQGGEVHIELPGKIVEAEKIDIRPRRNCLTQLAQ